MDKDTLVLKEIAKIMLNRYGSLCSSLYQEAGTICATDRLHHTQNVSVARTRMIGALVALSGT